MKNKDWTGGSASVFKGISASNHADGDRVAQDYYATEPKATEWLLKLEHFDGPILEPACGEGHIAEVLTRGGIPSFPGISSIEAMAKWQTFWLSTTWNGRAISSQTHPTPLLRRLWRKPWPLSPLVTRWRCSSNSPSSKVRPANTSSRHSHRHGYGSAAHVCSVLPMVTSPTSKALLSPMPGLSGKKVTKGTQLSSGLINSLIDESRNNIKGSVCESQ